MDHFLLQMLWMEQCERVNVSRYAMGVLLVAAAIQLSYKLVMDCRGQVITMPKIQVSSGIKIK